MIVGREEELERLERMVRRHRVVGVTGSPGVGKSALARAFAATRQGVVCSLLTAGSAEAVTRELAGALGLVLSPVATAAAAGEQIGRALARRGKALVVLDDADLGRIVVAKLLTKWMRDAERVRFVVTSRARIATEGAQRFDLGPLGVPEEGESRLEVVAASPSIRLFVRAAQGVLPDYRVRATTAGPVAEIVRRLEGVPLAIELCASRIVVLDEHAILELLEHELDVLDGGGAAADGRTLRGAFALSWDRLSPGVARVLAACSIFRGSFDLEAAAAIAIGSTGAKERLAIASALQQLEEASLLSTLPAPGAEQARGTRRYVLRASLRAFAAEKLAGGTTAREVARRHAVHLASLAVGDRRLPLDVLALVRADLEQAHAWALAAGDAKPSDRALAPRLLLALSPLVLARGPLAPFLARLDETLATRGLARAVSAELHYVRALARIFTGRRDEALDDLDDARRIARAAGDRRVEILAASKTGLIVGLKGDFGAAGKHFERARLLAKHVPGDPWLGGMVGKDSANVLSEEGRDDDAMIELARARDLFHAAEDAREEGFVIMLLGGRLLDGGRLGEARRELTEGLTLLRRAEDRRSESWALVLLSLVDAEEGDLARARERLDGAIASLRAIGDLHTEGIALGFLANVALEQGALGDADAAYREARQRLGKAGDRGSEAMCIAGAAVVDVLRGRLAVARKGFALAAGALEGEGRAARRDAVAILASLVSGSQSGSQSESESQSESQSESRETAPEEVRFARRIVARVRASSDMDSGRASDCARGSEIVTIARDGSWVRTIAGATVRVGRAGALRRILERLAVERVRRPGRAVGAAVLVAAGWPDEEILAGAAKNRLHVAIARLRRTGLDALLVRVDEGYLLDPRIPAQIAEIGEHPPDL